MFLQKKKKKIKKRRKLLVSRPGQKPPLASRWFLSNTFLVPTSRWGHIASETRRRNSWPRDSAGRSSLPQRLVSPAPIACNKYYGLQEISISEGTFLRQNAHIISESLILIARVLKQFVLALQKLILIMESQNATTPPPDEQDELLKKCNYYGKVQTSTVNSRVWIEFWCWYDLLFVQ